MKPQVVHIDFETRSPIDLKRFGAWIYAKHPETEILCLGYSIGSGKSRIWVPEYFSDSGTSIPELLLKSIERGDFFEAHNAFFEQVIWQRVCVERWDWPRLPLNRWIDSAAIAAARAMPRSLDGVSRALSLNETKDMTGHRVMLKLSKPRKPSKHNKAKYHAKESDFKTLYTYCESDVRTAAAVSSRLGRLTPGERSIWELDQRINGRGVYCDRQAVNGALRILETLTTEANERIQELTNGEINTIGQVKKIVPFLNDLGLSIDSIAKDKVEDALKLPHLDPIAREILELRQRSARSSTKKYQAMIDRMDSDDRIRELIMCFGAHTGRWTGKGIQIQNLPQGSIKDQRDIEVAIETIKSGNARLLQSLYSDPMDVLSSCLRGMLCAQPGTRLICADYSGIEARFLMWLCGEDRAVAMFEMGADIYKDLATVIFSKPFTQITREERDLGKRGVLGCGYQMAWKKFQVTCKVLFGQTVSDHMARKVVDAYRKRYKKVVSFWYMIEAAAIKATIRKGKRIHCGRITCQYREGFLWITLPSGRKLAYYDPKIADHPKFDKAQLSYMGVSSQTYKWERQFTYGGKLTENIVQASCFDVMAGAMLELDKSYPIVLTVHDEIVSEVKKGKGSLSEFCDIMAIVPDWARGLPLSVEGWEGKRFRK
ncbi:hypothetical protein GWN42_13500 [candidate division KSB1 bacterium]|nr:hypothetical protein [candidate division KSB1 bacterium]